MMYHIDKPLYMLYNMCATVFDNDKLKMEDEELDPAETQTHQV